MNTSIRKVTELGSAWFEPSEYVDQEVTEAFKNNHARLYEHEVDARNSKQQLIVIDGI